MPSLEPRSTPLPCKRCKEPLAEAAAFCVHCGTPAPRCQACHTPYTFEAPYCGHCGASLTSESQALLEVMAQRLTHAHVGALCQRAPEIHAFPIAWAGTNDVGADPKSAIALDEHTVSWHHAKLHWLQGALSVEDLQSTNGTFLNRRRLEPRAPAPLAHGDAVQFADVVLKVWLLPKHRP